MNRPRARASLSRDAGRRPRRDARCRRGRAACARPGEQNPGRIREPIAARSRRRQDPALEEHFLDQAQTQRKSEVKPNGIGDDLGWEALSLIAHGRQGREASASANRFRIRYCYKTIWGEPSNSIYRSVTTSGLSRGNPGPHASKTMKFSGK
jgi:hypothetical protein